MLRLTGFRTYSEFVRETNPYQRALLMQAIEAWHDKRDQGGGAGGAALGL